MEDSSNEANVAPDLANDILAAHCPVLYLHHLDKYRPVPVEWFISRAQLNYYPSGVTGTAEVHELDKAPGGVERLIPAGQVTQDKLLEAQASCRHPGNLSLTVGPEHYGGFCCDRLADVPIYAHAKLVVDDAGRPEAYEINYITFYAFNGHYYLPANLPLVRTGHHVGDWEHLTVRLDAASLELQGVWYNAHRNIEGEWCPAAEVPRSPCGRILGFVAINGHGIYPHCGTIPRLFFLANDRTSRRGPVWSPSRLVRLCGLPHGSGCPIVRSRGCSLPYTPPSARGPPQGVTRPVSEGGKKGLAPPSAASVSATGRVLDLHQRLVSETSGQREGSRCTADPDLDLNPGFGPCLDPGRVEAAAGRQPSGTLNSDGSGSTGRQQRAGEPDGTDREEAGPLHEVEGGPTHGPGPGEAPPIRSPVVTASREESESAQGPTSAPATLPPRTAESTTAVTAVRCAAPVVGGVGGSSGGGCDVSDGGVEGARGGSPAAPPPPPPPPPPGGIGPPAGELPRQFPRPEVILDTSPWQRYRGFWGSVVSATQQGWFLGPEPPVSRGPLRRLFLPLAKGVERLEPAKSSGAVSDSGMEALWRRLGRLKM